MHRYTIADTSYFNIPEDRKRNHRGLNIWTLSELRDIQGQTRSGELIQGSYQYPLFSLEPFEREEIMKSAAYVQAVITSRMNRISALEWTITTEKEKQEEIIYKLKHLKQLYDEYDNPNDMSSLVLRYKCYMSIKKILFDVKKDLSNFIPALRRYKKRIDCMDLKRTNEIYEWLSQPNAEDYFDDFIKKYIESLHVHGASALFKEWFPDRSKIDNFYILPGGSVYPLRGITVGSYVAYTQIIQGYMPKIYFSDEISFVNYIPSASRSYGYVPLDALINKVTEQLLFDQFAAKRADGTKEPEKLVVMGDNKSLFGDLTGDVNLPMDTAEQKRVEEKVNTARKGAIALLTGVGTPVVVDISKADTFSAQSERQDKLLRDIALLFNMTNMEVNLAGGQFTSGKECYSEDTETLTENGWKRLGEITENDKIACFNPKTNGLEYHKPKRLCVYHHEGEMLHFENKIIDILVTDNHKMYIAKNRKLNEWIKKEAKELPYYAYTNYFKNIAEWNDGEKIKTIETKTHITKMQTQPYMFNGDVFIEFLGYWISEGCIWKRIDRYNHESKVVEIGQKKKEQIKKIDKCIFTMGLKHSRKVNKQGVVKWVIYHDGLYDYLEGNCGKYQIERKIPKRIKNATKRQLKILYEALMDGDGHISKVKTHGHYCSISKKLIDDMCEIMIKIGKSIKTDFIIPGGNRTILYRVSFAKRYGMRIKKGQIKEVKYKGNVYCFETPTGLYYTRRNGKITIQGNTSESQAEIEEGKGTRPIIKKIETLVTKEIIPFRYGTGYLFEFQKGRTEEEQVDIDTKRVQSGTWTKNEIRIERGDDPIPGEENDKLESAPTTPPDGSQANPLNMRNI